MDVITTATHTVHWHSTGRSLLDAKLAAIAAAERIIRMETYIYTDTPIGRAFRDALFAAAQRGVEVKLLVDAIGGGDLPKDYFQALRDLPHADMKWFNEPSVAAWAFRDHRKLLTIDGNITFVGGCNIDTAYYGDGITEGWRDGGVRIDGALALDMEEEFDAQFVSADQAQWRLAEHRKARRQRRGTPHPDVRALFIQPGFGDSSLRDAVREDLKTAKDIAVTSAYFLPTRGLLDQFAAAIDRGARMRLMLGGISDVKPMQMATRSTFSRLLATGMEIFEYQPQILHAKMLVIDDAVYIGSSNLDPRSLRINFEIMVRIKDPGVAARARAQFDDDVKHSAMVSEETLWSQRWYERLLNMAARWVLGRMDPRVAENTLRRLEARA